MNIVLAAAVNGAVCGAVLAAIVWLALRAVPRRALNAATRYIIWWVVLAAVVALPLFYLPMPRLRREATPAPRVAVIPAAAPSAIVLPAPSATPARPPAIVAAPVSLPGPAPTASIAPAPAAPPPAPPRRPTPDFPLQISAAAWPGRVVYAWAAISLLLLLRLAASCFLLWRVSARAADPPSPLRARAARWSHLCGASSRGVRLAVSAEISGPIAVGPHPPSILIPAALLDQLSDEELDQLGLHEAAHLGRRDDWALLAQRAVEAVFVLHPVVRWVARRIDLEREIACDDRVIAAIGRPRSYAACLTRIVELSGCEPSLAAAGAAERASHLARRIDMLLDKTRHTGTRLLKGRLAATVAAMSAVAWAAVHSPALVAFPKPFGPPRLVRLLPKLPTPQTAAAQPPSRELAGQVLEDSSGGALASAELRFHQAGLRELAADFETDRAGRFRTTDLPPGDYTVDVSKPNFIPTTFKLHVPSSEVMLRLVRYGVIDGIARDTEGEPLQGRVLAYGGRTTGSARIIVFAKGASAEELHQFRQLPVDEGGHFRSYDLPPGQYIVGLWYSGLKQGSGMSLYPDIRNPRVFSVSGGEEYNNTNFTVEPRPAFSVRGRIDAPPGKQPYQIALGIPEQPALPVAQTLTEEDGTFRFDKIPAGTYDLFASGPTGGYGPYDSILAAGEPKFGRTRVQVLAQDVDGLTVAMGPAKPLTVTLRGVRSDTPPQGCPAAATVNVSSLEPWAIMFQTNAQVPAGKETTIKGLAPGRFRLIARSLGATCYQANEPVVDLNSDVAGPAAIELALAGAIHGQLKGASGALAGVAVALIDSTAVEQPEAKLAFPDASGRFAFDGLRPGRYRIVAQRTTDAKSRWVTDVNRMVEIEVPGGSPTTVELPVTASGGLR